jgi:hypothetical protein
MGLTTNTNMKTLHTLLLILSTFLAESALVMLSDTAFVAALPGDKLLAVFFGIAILAFAVWDYSRPIKTIRLRTAPLLRPPLPFVTTPALRGKLIRPRAARAERTVA